MNQTAKAGVKPEITRPVLEVVGVSKAFGGILALDHVNLIMRPGEIHAIVGENGAGKSTLIRMLGGVHSPDTGEILLAGEPISISSPLAAARLGIAVIYQEPSVFPDLDVGENIFVGRQPLTPGWPRIDRSRMYREAGALLRRLGARLDARAAIRGLSVAGLQLVEMAAALSHDARTLFVDEPTASLTPAEAEDLFAILRELRRAGTAIGFISHRLEEVFALADWITVLRDGRVTASGPVEEFDQQKVIQAMVGRPLDMLVQRSERTPGDPMLQVENLSADGYFAQVSFEVRASEIVGLAGLVGAGRTEIARAIFAIDQAHSGRVLLGGREVRFRHPGQAVRAGVAYVPEDRQQHGLVWPMSIAENVSLASLGRVSRLGWVRRGVERHVARRWSTRLAVRSRDVDQRVSELSGGNQQKAVLGKWLETRPRLLILDEPTRGVDVGAKAEIHRLMEELASHGVAILMISSELPEILAMSDRVIVIRDGSVAAVIERAEATAESVMAAAIGLGRAVGLHVAESVKGRPLVAGSFSPSFPVRIALTLSRFRQVGLALFIGVLVAGLGLASPRFLQLSNLSSILLDIALIGILAVGQTLVMLTRNLDLSIGSTVGVSAMAVGILFKDHPGFPIFLGFPIGVCIGLAVGLLNGLAIATLKLPSIVFTLGMLSLVRGLVYVVSGGQQVNSNDVPQHLVDLSLSGPVGIPATVLITAGLALLAAAALRTTRTGRSIYATGSNPTAARLHGVPAWRVTVIVFAFSGALAGLTGVLFISRFAFVQVTSGAGMELTVVAAVVIGGVSIFGGSGTIAGAMLGVLLLGIIGNGFAVAGLPGEWEDAVLGLLILLAVTANSAAGRIQARGRRLNRRPAR